MNLLEISNYDLESMHLDWCRADMLRRVALGVYGTSNFGGVASGGVAPG